VDPFRTLLICPRFLLAEFQFKYVVEMAKTRPGEVENALKSLPSSPDDAYTRTMKRIRDKQTKIWEMAFEILSWVFHAARPLLMDELREALSVRVGDHDLHMERFPPTDTIVEVCESLIVHDVKSGTVRFTHFSIMEFFRKGSTQGILPNTHPARTCFTYLAFNEFDEPCVSYECTTKRLQNYKFGVYAATFWGLHIRGDLEGLSEIRNAVFQLLEPKGRRLSILQLVNPFDAKNQSLLHILAQNGLATICKAYLDAQYTADLTEAD
jgi:hypothetical protein